MRGVITRQLRLGHADIGSLTFNPRSRDDIPQVLQGLQYICVTDELREASWNRLTASSSTTR